MAVFARRMAVNSSRGPVAWMHQQLDALLLAKKEPAIRKKVVFTIQQCAGTKRVL